MKFRYLFPLLIVFCAAPLKAQYGLQDAFPNLPVFSLPLGMQMPADGSNRIFIIQQKGQILFFQNDPGVTSRKIFLDLSAVVSQPTPGQEIGLLGLAFHPDFKTNGYFYVNYTSSPGGQLTSFISRFQVNPLNTDTVLNNTEQILITLPQPFPNHKGGHLDFGPDGYLYASFGDGGFGGDPLNRAQNRDSLFGKILRIDVNKEANGKHYAIPADNPFANSTKTYRQEIFAYGLRNPWKFSFDAVTRKLWVSDVGQNLYEEIDIIINGGNYGWNLMEGFHCYPSGGFTCDSTGFIPPIWEYPHLDAAGNKNGDISITGGYVYRGSNIPSLTGKYIYGDYGSGKIWALQYDGINSATNQLLLQSPTTNNLSSFGQDQNNEIYLVGYLTGKLYKLIAVSSVNSGNPSVAASLNVDRTILDDLHPSSNIHFNLTQSDHITISLFNTAGQEVQHLLDRDIELGEHEVQLNTRSLANGMYFITLATNTGTLSQKISVIK